MLVSAIYGQPSKLVSSNNVQKVRYATLSEVCIALALADRSPVEYICQSVKRIGGHWQCDLIRLG